GVEEAARIDLVDDGTAPPGGIAHSHVHAIAARVATTRRMTTLPGLAASLTAARADAVIVHTYSWMTAIALQHPPGKILLDVHT
ncbi:MAG TPA: hypothetical protein VN614_02100, partial [Rhodanobacter sp.]|nr:hypothetical protein [Rhodanobacter sp.]